MPSIEQCFHELKVHFELINSYMAQIEKISHSPLDKAQRDELMEALMQRKDADEERIKKSLKKLTTFPPHHDRHFQLLDDFHKGGAYDKSVFIMTKFPEGNSDLDNKLRTVIEIAQNAIRDAGFIPRIANEKSYHAGLWDNVEVYLFGCQRGIAIVESKYNEELNPNVMMEWGWMRGMGRKVLYLVERTFDLGRADIEGLLQSRFNWEDPEMEIKTAVTDFLK